MQNALFPVAEGNNLPVTADLADDLVSLGSTAGASDTNYLKFTKTGAWVFGRDDDECDSEEVIAVNPTSFTIGYQGWEDGMPQDGPVVPISQRATLPAESELPKLKDGEMNGWNKMLGVAMRTMADGINLQFNTTSYGGKQAITELMKAVGLGIKEHPEAPVALVVLEGESYKHKTYGKIHTPVIRIVGWADGSGNEVAELAVK
jgi:hypothetical protein